MKRLRTPQRIAKSTNRKPTSDRIIAISAIFFLLGLIAFVGCYESTLLDTSFERFMDDQNFGVRILFTGLGVAISIFWGYYFSPKSHFSAHFPFIAAPPNYFPF
ncbi:hypothetical protein B0T26DRAFT_440393 [Lasiosphaeria miniovina]|uniref:Uncharacterized protein n=1 Tax=Lasiosphaeria miniovina TaxID=1954250 RepID=A0AA39ZYJ3_9PEZI|nr:uncharacterized protein B0T26DRAFT_440393 [Lasiosphaeria miniovina]KAK0706006.1 hypothetical protein B0T26DRAFT_440393 [Lasiosphaeria miniovina]